MTQNIKPMRAYRDGVMAGYEGREYRNPYGVFSMFKGYMYFNGYLDGSIKRAIIREQRA